MSTPRAPGRVHGPARRGHPGLRRRPHPGGRLRLGAAPAPTRPADAARRHPGRPRRRLLDGGPAAARPGAGRPVVADAGPRRGGHRRHRRGPRARPAPAAGPAARPRCRRPCRSLVVDDGSADPGPTRAVAAEFGARLLRHQVSRGPAAARNTGLARVRTELVAFLDSDVVPVPGWLGLLRRHLDDPAVGVVGPRVLGGVPQPGDGWLCRYEAARSSLDLGPRPAPVQPLGRVAYLPSAALLARRSALLPGGPDGTPAPPGSTSTMPVAEDVDLVWRLHEAGLAGALRAGGRRTPRPPDHAAVPGCGARRSTAPAPRCSPSGTAPTSRRWC